jgi:uncharacterized protein involved in exopolysaccharide biosynthesis
MFLNHDLSQDQLGLSSPVSDAAMRVDRVRLSSSAFGGFTLRDLATALFYYKRLLAVAFIVPVLLGIAAGMMAHTTYTSSARLLVLYGSEYVFHPGNRDTGNDITLDRNQIIQGELQILQSPALAAEVLQAVGPTTVYPNLKDDASTLRAAMSRFATDLVVTSIPQSNVVELSLRNADRGIAIRVLNELITHYLTYRTSIFEKQQTGGVNTQRDDFALRLRNAEDELAQFGIDHGITNLDEQMSLQLRLKSENATAQSANDQQISETAASLDGLRKQLASVPPNVQMFAESARSQQTTGLTDSLVKLEIQRRDLLSRYQADFPLVRDMDRQIAAVREQIGGDPAREANITRLGRNTVYDELHRNEIIQSAQLQGYVAKKAALEAEGVRLQARYDELGGLARHYRDLQRTRDVLDQSYRAISRSSEETQLSGAMERASGDNVRVVQPPDAPLAGRNPGSVIYMAGLVLGVVSAAAVFAFLNATRQVFISVHDVERQMDLPVLLAVPFSVRRPVRAAPARGRRVLGRPSFGV